MLNKIKTGKKLIFLAILVFIFLPVFVQAAPSWWPIVPCGLNAQPKDSNGVELPKVPTQENPDAHDYTQPCNRCDLFKLFKNIIDFVLVGLMPPIAAILFVWGGFLILMGGANPGWISQGKTIFWNTFMGVVIISASWLITNTIIKSLAEESITNPNVPWYQFECKTTVAQQPPAPQPPAQKYSCQNNQCAESPSGTYTEPTCNNSCGETPPVQKYTSNSNNQCVVDPNGQYSTNNCNNECAPAPPVPTDLIITTTSLSDATQSTAYSQSISATGGTTPHTWSISSGNLPTGLSLNSSGAISGTPTTTGTSTFTVKVEDSSTPKKSATKQLTLTIKQSAGGVCLQSNLNLCQPKSMSCSASACSQYTSSINKYAGGAASANLLKAIMIKESACSVSAASGFDSYGLMQLRPSTANIYKSRCSITANITGAWLTTPANADASICIAAEYIKALAQTACGNNVRGIAAGYNGGSGACGNSADCAGENSCAGGPKKKWECLYDNPQHTVCNGGDQILDGYNQTRDYVVKVLYCYNNPGF